jgi:hypothetical protein
MQPSLNQPQAREPTVKPRRHQPYKRRTVPNPFLAIPNARCREGKALRTRRAELVAHCGGAPSAVQMTLIDRIIMLTWQSMQVDRLSASATGQQAIDLLERADKLANTLGRALSRLGLEAQAPAEPSLRDTLAALRGRTLPSHQGTPGTRPAA